MSKLETDIEDLRTQVLTIGKTIEKGTTHKLERPFIDSIICTLQYFGADDAQLKMASFDLHFAKYKIYDWLAMCCNGRMGDDPAVQLVIYNMAKLYITQKNVGGFAWWLRGHDLDVEAPARCQDCIESYKNWKEEIQ